ncbi:MAG: sigma-70 family RNA polymerase sigma factor [Chloroflexi bacterium]|nr:sigma-70 family RNA polymerase sigma factor [Chloroflexota bacterium]
MSLSSEGTSDSAAFEQLVEEYGDRVYGIALRITGSPADAEDAMQDAFLQAFRSWPSFRGESSPTTWLYRIAVNAALMRVRSRRPVEPLDDVLETDEIVEWSADALQAVLRGELNEQIGAGIARLPDEMRVVLILRDIESLSTAETAATLDITEAAVKSRLHRARTILRAYLGGLLASDR